MKYIKTYEIYGGINSDSFKNKKDDDKNEEYVILDINWHRNDKDFDYYLNNTIGQIFKIKKNYTDYKNNEYQILYENTPKEFKLLQHNRLSYVYTKQIKHHSSNKEELELILQAKKYNI